MLVNELHQGGIRALLAWDSSIFDDMSVPEGIDASEVVDHIIYKYGDAPLFSPDPEILKYYIGKWSARRLPLWQRYAAAISAEYDPLENYDRIETHTETREGTSGHSGTVSTDDTGSIDTADTGTVTNTSIETTTDQRSADNSDQWAPYDRQLFDSNGTTTNDLSRAEERDLNRLERRDLTDEHEETISNESRVHGNIGVTTSQQMLASELDLIPRLDLIDYIADDWHDEFNLMIYY